MRDTDRVTHKNTKIVISSVPLPLYLSLPPADGSRRAKLAVGRMVPPPFCKKSQAKKNPGYDVEYAVLGSLIPVRLHGCFSAEGLNPLA